MTAERERRWWTEEEDDVLRARVQLQEADNGQAFRWNEVAVLLPGRTNKDCRKRWSKVQAGINKGAWTRVEDEKLQKAVENQGAKWALVSKSVRTRNADQCAKRWQHVLGPGCKHGPWTTEEDRKLLDAIEKHGNNWKQIGLLEFHGRSSHDIRNRSVALTRRGRNRDSRQDTRSSSNDIEEAMQQRSGSNVQYESELGFSEEHGEDDVSGMNVDSKVETPHPSIGERAGTEFPSGSSTRDTPHTIEDIEIDQPSSTNSVWTWPDFTAHPLVFDEHHLPTTPDTVNSSNCDHTIDATISTPSYLHSGFATSSVLPLQEIDSSALEDCAMDTAKAFRNHHGTFDDAGGHLPFVLDSPQHGFFPTTVPEKKGHVTISLKHVDTEVAQDITSSILKYNDSLVIRLHLE
ncbi:hypothetical protein GT037_007334 [Alternaria burnsii]|uniref:Uncharacterized protein n=1 Tax=Alternaria burnsii TaxID=1187904 RepID=A0A8H7AZT1_9PLEO|nr:uncharacterized protein GT037_007334 [Alternaria burnsii]KAF7674574.1 hypothetical protein GT037_007334 [Alternaria burnsii]